MRLFNFLLLTGIYGLPWLSAEVTAQYNYQKHVNHRLSDMTYSARPDRNDTLCLEGLRHAENDILEGGKFFCIPVGLAYGKARMQDALLPLLRSRGFSIVWDSIPEKNANEPEKCYCARMIRYQIEKFGKTFRWKMYHTADSIFADSVIRYNERLHYWLCDEYPSRSTGEEKRHYIYPMNPADSTCLKMGFIDMGYTIGINGDISDLYLKRDNRSIDIDSLCMERIFNFMEKELANEKWRPGKLHGKAVNTVNSARIYLKLMMNN